MFYYTYKIEKQVPFFSKNVIKGFTSLNQIEVSFPDYAA